MCIFPSHMQYYVRLKLLFFCVLPEVAGGNSPLLNHSLTSSEWNYRQKSHHLEHPVDVVSHILIMGLLQAHEAKGFGGTSLLAP